VAVKVQYGKFTLQSTLLAMARRATLDIRARAFPDDASAGKDLDGTDFAPLSPSYLKWKVAKGRPGVSDQRFTSKTANALGVTKRTPREVHLGFRVRRDIADHLNQRNKFWGLTGEEHLRALAVADQYGKNWAGSVKISGVIIIQAKPGTP
jgi:hypothetical protein